MQTIIRDTKFPEFKIGDDYILREQRFSDAEDFFKYFADPKVAKYILSSIPNNLSEAQEEIMYWIDLYYKNTGIYWAIATKDSNNMIGAIGFHDWNKYNNRVEISYDLSKEYWGKGIMSQATNLILDFAFNKLRINRIQASTIKENVNSIKLLKRHKFMLDGVLRKYRYHDGRYYDVEMFSILRSDFSKKLWNFTSE